MTSAFIVTNGHTIRVPATEARTREDSLARAVAYARNHFMREEDQEAFIASVRVRELH